jgi:hypothetical protein
MHHVRCVITSCQIIIIIYYLHILHVCVHYCMMYNMLCTTLCTLYIDTCVVLCRHIQTHTCIVHWNGWNHKVYLTHMSCDGPWPFILWEKITFSFSVTPSSYSALQVNCSLDMLCNHEQKQQGAITTC